MVGFADRNGRSGMSVFWFVMGSSLFSDRGCVCGLESLGQRPYGVDSWGISAGMIRVRPPSVFMISDLSSGPATII